MSARWQISAGELFELTRPAAFALSALVSTWVLASARRRGFAFYWVAAWTLGTLFYPLIILPIYLIVLMAGRRTQEHESQSATTQNDSAAPPTEPTTHPSTKPTQHEQKSHLRLRWTLPALYLLTSLSLGALYYYRDAQSIDAHLARANQARLVGRRDKTIREYRAALQLEENAHTRNLLGIELAASGQLEAALVEFRAAERGGEPDDELPLRIANALDALNRPAEAMPEYQKFLGTRRCMNSYPDPQCAAAKARLKNVAQ